MWLWFAGEGVTTFALVTSCLSPAAHKAGFVRGKECESHEFLSESSAEEEWAVNSWNCLTQSPDPCVCGVVVWGMSCQALESGRLGVLSKQGQGTPRAPDISMPECGPGGHCVFFQQ